MNSNPPLLSTLSAILRHRGYMLVFRHEQRHVPGGHVIIGGFAYAKSRLGSSELPLGYLTSDAIAAGALTRINLLDFVNYWCGIDPRSIAQCPHCGQAMQQQQTTGSYRLGLQQQRSGALRTAPLNEAQTERVAVVAAVT